MNTMRRNTADDFVLLQISQLISRYKRKELNYANISIMHGFLPKTTIKANICLPNCCILTRKPFILPPYTQVSREIKFTLIVLFILL